MERVEWTRFKRSSNKLPIAFPGHRGMICDLSQSRVQHETVGDCFHGVSFLGAAFLICGGSVVANWRRWVKSSLLIGVSRFKACSRRWRLSNAVSQHSRWRHKYAPRPDFFPVTSASTRFSVVRTIRSSSRLLRTVRQAMHVRCGICLAGISSIVR